MIFQATHFHWERDGGHYILNGEKTWISNAGIADFYTVFARTGEALAHRPSLEAVIGEKEFASDKKQILCLHDASKIDSRDDVLKELLP